LWGDASKQIKSNDASILSFILLPFCSPLQAMIATGNKKSQPFG
jgi:hypothetical protein